MKATVANNTSESADILYGLDKLLKQAKLTTSACLQAKQRLGTPQARQAGAASLLSLLVDSSGSRMARF